MQKRIYLFSLLVSLFFISCQANETAPTNTANTVIQNQEAIAVSLSNSDWISKMTENPGMILDVRTPGEYDQGYIEGAKLVDVSDASFLENLSNLSIDRSTPIYLYCRSGSRSKKAMTILKNDGYTEIYEMDGGIMGWENEGLPIVK